jgi:hypothetical protein
MKTILSYLHASIKYKNPHFDQSIFEYLYVKNCKERKPCFIDILFFLQYKNDISQFVRAIQQKEI